MRKMFLVLTTSPPIDHCTKVYSVEIDIICLTCPPSLRDDVGPKSLPFFRYEGWGNITNYEGTNKPEERMDFGEGV